MAGTKPESAHPFQALADLREQLLAQEKAREKEKKVQAAQKLTALKARPAPEPEVDGETMFWREMADVVPLKDPAKRLVADPPLPGSFKRPPLPNEDTEVLDYLTELVSGRAEFDLTYSDEYVEGRLKSLPSKVMSDLRAGKIPTQDYLDLHGLTLSQAEQAIVKFVLNSVGLRRRCLLLVHGRGHRSQDGIPILKHNLENLLLRYPIKKHILAFATARPIDGGAGACYILLRR